MLIASERHRPEDLRLWAELEEADMVHGERLMRSGKAGAALQVVRDFTTAGPCYCSVSWGKDSVVLAHLWSRSSVDSWAFWHARPERMLETEQVEEAFLASHPLRYHRVECPGDWAVAEYRRISGATRYATGVRADESSVRKISARVHGVATGNACRPLLWWTAQDVFGYLAYHHLPVHPVYAMVGGGRWNRHRLRVEVLGGAEAEQFGRREWEAEYYGDVLRRRQVQAALDEISTVMGAES